MPLIKNTDYKNPRWLFNGHMQTIAPSLLRRPISLSLDRERVSTPDGDFLDLDWLRKGCDRLVIISHGLEGNSQRPYMLGMARYFFLKNFDVLNWNFRGCSGEINKKPIFYHSGATYDLDTVITHAAKNYAEVYLIGFSLGGNLTLKYLGEDRKRNPKIKKGVGISVPLHLQSSCSKISSSENILYSTRFLSTLKKKVIKKSLIFPDKIPVGTLRKIKTLQDFDNHFTGPIHGFKDANDYYEKNSALHFIDQIQIPTLILNAQNDPFLSEQCYPISQAKNLEKVWMEFPKYGGHVGFSPRKSSEIYWSEKRAFEFINADH